MGSKKLIKAIILAGSHDFGCCALSSLDKNLFDKCLMEASSVISHAGMGTITMTLSNNKPLLVMPRLKKYGEVVNNHQAAIAKRFSELGHLLIVYDVKDLPDGIRKLKNFIPRKRKASPDAIADRIRRFLSSLPD